MSASFFTEGPEGDEVAAAAALARAWAIAEGYPDAVNDPGMLSSRAYAIEAQTALNAALAGAQAAQAGAEAAQTAAEAAQAGAEAAAVALTGYAVTTPYIIPLTYYDAAPLVDDAESIFMLEAGTITEVSVGMLTTQSSGTAVAVEFKLNGAIEETVSLPNGDNIIYSPASIAVAKGDVVTTRCSAVGSGGAGLRVGFLFTATPGA